MQDVTSEPPPLPYRGPADFAARRRRIGRRVVMAVATLAVACAAYLWVRPFVERRWQQYWHDRCAAYTAPADQVVLRAGPRDPARPRPPAREFIDLSSDQIDLAQRRPPSCWTRLARARPDIAPFQEVSPVFLHRRKAGQGPERLVCLGRSTSWSADKGVLIYLEAVFSTPSDPVPLRRSSRAVMAIWDAKPEMLSGAGGLVLYAGQPDPDDESHFTIRYELGGVSGTIDGWLREHEVPHKDKTVKFAAIELAVRDGPGFEKQSE